MEDEDEIGLSKSGFISYQIYSFWMLNFLFSTDEKQIN